MRLDDEQESSNFEVQQGGGGMGGGFGGGNLLGFLLPMIGSRFGCGGIAVVLLIFAVMGGGLNLGSLVGGGGGSAPSGQVAQDPAQLTEIQHWSLKVLGSTERVWEQVFSQNGQRYQPATLVFYSQSGMSGCGAAQSAMGPFYCPNDQRIYLDTEFFTELRTRFGSPGDFAQAYVIAHEVGHHIQDMEGTLRKVHELQGRASEAEGNAMQVRVELQADCYAGVWGKLTGLMEAGDLQEGLKAAQAIGDDTLQRNAGRAPMPDSFTHGSSEQRMRWLKRGLDTGDPARCDAFSGDI
ncbi:MAG: zinc metallopeptidase [Sphingobium sp.]|nr:zinc metallopeptidase [Sphingobium sp.]MBP6111138.1 zinc metallopeptidase [Sphingobium sp.]MBP8672026.1 zinc metallopeptidase [Sphingobium sp.]MBP9158001.1 zinc metallopeptidase [Sphingobium sp.]MCC6482792.1 zinc metallopeptidase [Sphingomonadaceae bacterium]